MIDIHTHVLPQFDDGPASVEAALAMLRMAARDGTTDIVATPHFSSRYRLDTELRDGAIARLQQACGPAPAIHAGCDLRLEEDTLEQVLAAPARYTLGGRDCLLVDFADQVLADRAASALLERLVAGGIRPVIAHPERNPLLQRSVERLARWVSMGCLVQITAQSVLGGFGRAPRNAAQELLRRGLVHFVASEAHDYRHRPPLLSGAWSAIARVHGNEAADALLAANPRAALDGVAVPAPRVGPGRPPAEARQWLG